MTHIVDQECTCYCPETRYSCRGYGCEEDPNGIYTTFDSCVEAYNAGACIPPLCDGVICDDPSWVIDLDSCLCAPPPTNPPPPPPTPTPTLPCDRDSSAPNGTVTVKGYAYYFDTVTSVSIPGLPDPLESRCAGGHRCNRATFIPQLSFGSLAYISTDVSLNNAPCNGSCDRSATFEFSNIALSSFATQAKFNLLCKNPNTNCHNGITWVVLTTEVDGNTIKLFDSCITPGKAVPLDYGCPDCDCDWDGNGFIQFSASCNSLLVPATWTQVGAYEWFLQGNLSCGDQITSTVRCDPSKPASPCYQKWFATIDIPCVTNLFLRTPDESCTCDTPPWWPIDGDNSTCDCCTTPTPTPTVTSSQTPTPTPTPPSSPTQTPTVTPTPTITPSNCHYVEPCEQGYVLDLQSCQCVPEPTVTDPPEWTDPPPKVPCTPTDSVTIEGYAYYFDTITTVNIPGVGNLVSPCAGGHYCNRTNFMPKLVVGNSITIDASNAISLNNGSGGGDRSDTFSFSVTDTTIFQDPVNITLECITPGGCHNGVTWIVLTYTDSDTGITSLIFSDCVVPGSLDGINITCDYSDYTSYSDYTDLTPPSPPVVLSPPPITTDPTPPIEGTSEPGTTIIIYNDGTPIGTTTTQPDGTWEFTPSDPITDGDGVTVITATSTDSAGNTSNPSVGYPVTVNTQVAWICEGNVSGCSMCYGCSGFPDTYSSESECQESCIEVTPPPTPSVTPTVTPTVSITPSVTPTITPGDYSDYTSYSL